MKNAKNVIAAVVLVAMTALTLDVSAADKPTGDPVVNLNTASVTQLAYLPGIGQSKASAIIKHREKREFKKVEDLMRVKGIGRKTFKKIRSHLAIEGQTTAKGKIKL